MTHESEGHQLSVAFLGYLVTNRRALEDPLLSLADNRMQLGYLQALGSRFASVTAVSSIPARPGESASPTQDGLSWRHVRPTAAGALRPLLKLIALYRELALWARSVDEPRVLVYYNTFLIYGLVARVLRTRHQVAVVPIAITLPYRTPDSAVPLRGRLQGKIAERFLRHVDGLIAISPFLGQVLAPRVPACVVQGGVTAASLVERASAPRPREEGPRRIVYAGNLTPRYNLETVVSAMELLPGEEYELHLYGRGTLEGWLRCVADRSPAIHLHAAVDADSLPAILAEADVLLALLSTDDNLARYSFPSKLFESLASGTPTITTDLPTLEESMRAHLVVIDRLDAASLAQAVVEVSQRSENERQRAAAAAVEYLRESATWAAVGDRLHDYLTHLKRWSA